MTTPQAHPAVFLSYARSDLAQAQEVYAWLARHGIACWMDVHSLRGAENWRSAIDLAIRRSHIFIACLSTRAVTHRGFFQTELKTAFEVWKTVPSGQVFLLPLRLDDCDVPPEIADVHYIDFFAPGGPARLAADITHHLAPVLPAQQLPAALEHIRQGRPLQAAEILRQLRTVVDHTNPDLRLRVLYDLACAESLIAASHARNSPESLAALGAAVAYLEEWYAFGSGGAWAQTGRTSHNEVFRMGSDSDLSCVLALRPAEVRAVLGDAAAALPGEPPPRRPQGGGGGCVLLTEPVDTPRGLVRLEDLRDGMIVHSAGLAEREPVVPARILRVYTSRERRAVVLNDRLMLSSSQPLFDTDAHRIEAGQLRVGMRLRAPAGRLTAVESVTEVTGHFEVATLSVDHPSHTFVCSELILGNKTRRR